ncbi:MAG: lipoprotein-releasing system ATP-binding protein LolD [Cellvibrionales bacterium TMED49]|nr:lipoprotein-releasing system ATP-binding protein LolD [Porticoccaceae bacterium]OUU37696.1 MAG: lipoprotein-releasing system ATP-binding protein LolD [Cellvibrionales bacterium TMED49]|tara:strand:- start:625 stop:1320 length:696 start_codon:yes stop_codon:yes gene_type:complete
MSSNIVLKAMGLSKSYSQGSEEISVLKDFNLEVMEGDKVAIMGASGSGKTTLLNLCGGLDRPTSGVVRVCGVAWGDLDPSAQASWRNKHVGFVYQFHHLLAEFSALENVAIPALIGKAAVVDARNLALDLLHRVGLEHRLDHIPSSLSGGERQRVAIARALVTHPSVVLMDEPTGNLDITNTEAIMDLLAEVSDDMKVSFVVVTHDIAVAKHMDRIIQLDCLDVSDGEKIV